MISVDLSRSKEIMRITEVRLDDLSKVCCRYFTAEMPELKHRLTLIIEFSGECGYGSGNNGDVDDMQGMIAAGFKAWNPSCLILDLRNLKYQWGDMMIEIFAPPHDLTSMTQEKVGYPLAAVASDLNRYGLTSLIMEEMQGNPKDILFETLDDARKRVIEMAKRYYRMA